MPLSVRNRLPQLKHWLASSQWHPATTHPERNKVHTMRWKTGCRASPRRGVATLELILAVPIIAIMLLAMVEYGSLMILQSTVTHAATVGAREAGKTGDIEEVVEAVGVILDTHCIDLSDAADSGTKVIVENGDGFGWLFGDPNLDCTPPSEPLLGDEIRVTVCVALEATPICDALGPLGFPLAGKRLQLSSVVKKEFYWITPELAETSVVAH